MKIEQQPKSNKEYPFECFWEDSGEGAPTYGRSAAGHTEEKWPRTSFASGVRESIVKTPVSAPPKSSHVREEAPPGERQKLAPLDTLAQPVTEAGSGCGCDSCDNFEVSAVTSVDDRPALLKRARRKFVTVGYVGALVDAAKLNEESNLTKSYWNTYHCARILTLKSDGKVSGHYCKNRWCLVCNSIRTAQLINRYGPIMEGWEDRHFATLTIPNVTADQLPSAVRFMQELFVRVKNRLKVRAHRGQCPKFEGLRKLEVTYNPERNDFHPHYHFICSTAEAARQLVACWLEAYNASFEAAIWGEASALGQDVRPADSGACQELFKYFSKVISGSKKSERYVYADALDVIFNAVKGTRVFQPFGFKAPALELEPEAEEAAALAGLEEAEAEAEAYALAEYTWSQEASDWQREGLAVDLETGEVSEEAQPLTGYVPGDALRELIDQKVIVRPGHSWERYGRAKLILAQGGQPLNEDEEREVREWLDRGRRLMEARALASRAKERRGDPLGKQLSVFQFTQ